MNELSAKHMLKIKKVYLEREREKVPVKCIRALGEIFCNL